MDMRLSAPVHFDAYVAVEIIDENWLTTKLPVEEVNVPGVTLTATDDDDEPSVALAEADNEFKWHDLHTLIEQ